ncbi:MAG: hypothetical protein MHM6MM_008013 [Cercozoa sp. M6MM]
MQRANWVIWCYVSSHGRPVADDNSSLTIGPEGPILLQDVQLVSKLAHFDRERIPERVVHAKGAGAHGYFEVTHDVTRFCKAKFLSRVGKRTPVFVRFSTVGGEKGSADTARDPRGFAIKHYTEEGIWDMTGNNTPVFFIRDPTKFPDFIHTQKRNAQTNCADPEAFWDFLTLTQESAHQVMILMSDRGVPDGYRHMNGYSSHTFKIVNAQNEAFYVKFHYKTDQGIKCLDAAEAQRLAGADPDYATRDLFDAIQRGEAPSWTAYMQIMPVADAARYRFNVFDVTKVWSHKDYPLVPFGKLVLNRNPKNYFAEVEQSAFSPGHLVPGVEISFDRMLQARVFSYPDTHRHRLGPNYMQLPVNCPYASPLGMYERDSYMASQGNGGSGPNYYPNSDPTAPKPDPTAAEHGLTVQGRIGRYARPAADIDFVQPRALYNDVMSPEQRNVLVGNIVGNAKNASPAMQERVVAYFTRIDRQLGQRVQDGLRRSRQSRM